MNLRAYRSVADGRKPPGYLRAADRKVGALSLKHSATRELWAVHSSALLSRGNRRQGPSLLDLKIELADRMLRRCRLCERRCGVNRAAGQTGFCGVGADTRYFFEQTLWGEEKPLVPSHEVFFSGCNMRCSYCYSWEAVANASYGEAVLPLSLARMIDFRHREGAVNANLIGGEPTVHLPTILRALRVIKSPTAIVWNSNFFMSRDAMRLLDGVIDLYVGDFRFGNDQCARRIALTDGYVSAARRNFKLAASSGDLIIRHLLIPGHVECCLRPIAEWVASRLRDVPFNLMFQYLPQPNVMADPILGTTVSPEEKKQAARIVSSLSLNATRWNRPLRNKPLCGDVGVGEISTTVTILPDGRVSIKHLHGDLLDVRDALQDGGTG